MKTDIMVDAAYKIITSDCKIVNGNQFYDDEVLGDVDLKAYQQDPSVDLKNLIPDLYT